MKILIDNTKLNYKRVEFELICISFNEVWKVSEYDEPKYIIKIAIKKEWFDTLLLKLPFADFFKMGSHVKFIDKKRMQWVEDYIGDNITFEETQSDEFFEKAINLILNFRKKAIENKELFRIYYAFKNSSYLTISLRQKLVMEYEWVNKLQYGKKDYEKYFYCCSYLNNFECIKRDGKKQMAKSDKQLQNIIVKLLKSKQITNKIIFQHNDIHFCNILNNKSKLYLIDLDTMSLNFHLFDIGYFLYLTMYRKMPDNVVTCPQGGGFYSVPTDLDKLMRKTQNIALNYEDFDQNEFCFDIWLSSILGTSLDIIESYSFKSDISVTDKGINEYRKTFHDIQTYFYEFARDKLNYLVDKNGLTDIIKLQDKQMLDQKLGKIK